MHILTFCRAARVFRGYYGTHRQATARTSKRWTGVTEKALSVGELETARHKLRRRALERIRRKVRRSALMMGFFRSPACWK